jgi:hypothetical protein
MPYQNQWVDPELFMTHNGVEVYRTYKDDDVDNGFMMHWFTLETQCGMDYCICAGLCINTFDVQELQTWKNPPHPPFLTGDQDTPENRAAWHRYEESGVMEKGIKEAIREALDIGLIGGVKGVKEWRPKK